MEKVWVVEFGWDCEIHAELFHTEQEASNEYQSLPERWYRKMYKTNDIWGWTERRARDNKLLEIARKYLPAVEEYIISSGKEGRKALETNDVFNVDGWSLKSVLEAAYRAGKEAGIKKENHGRNQKRHENG